MLPHSQPSQFHRKQAFTLLELLVVVAVIGIVAGLLLPALQRGRQAAQASRCTTNLRQLGLAAIMYWDDHDGRTFRYRGPSVGDGDLFWFGWLERGAEGQRRFDAAQGVLFPYLVGRGVETCPGLDYAMKGFKLKAAGAAYGYGYNFDLSTPSTQPARVISQLNNPSKLAVFVDCAQINTFQAPASPENPMLEEFYYFNSREPTVHFRHARKAAVAAADGHVEQSKPLAGSLDTRLSAQLIGRINDDWVKR